MEDPMPCEIIKCEPAELDLLPESIGTFPYGLSCDSENNEDNVLPSCNLCSPNILKTSFKVEKNEKEEKHHSEEADDDEVGIFFGEVQETEDIFEPSAMAIDGELKKSAEPVAMFEFVGLLASTDDADDDGTKEVASEMSMLGKMRANIVKALCKNDRGTISKLSDPIPVVGNKLLSQMKTVFNTIIGCEENSEGSVDGSNDEDPSQLGPNLYFCEKCCKCFNQKSDLKRHALIHVLKYRCGACNMGFQMKANISLAQRGKQVYDRMTSTINLAYWKCVVPEIPGHHKTSEAFEFLVVQDTRKGKVFI